MYVCMYPYPFYSNIGYTYNLYVGECGAVAPGGGDEVDIVLVGCIRQRSYCRRITSGCID